VRRKWYKIIYADPPWDFGGRKLNAATGGKEINDHYPTMKVADIAKLPVGKLASKNAVLFMWTTYTHLPAAFEIAEAWGFKYSTVAFEWLKRTSTGKPVCFMGAWVCGGAIELCLLFRRGKISRVTKNTRRLVDAPRGRHSAKPPEVRDRIVHLMGDISRIELFSRDRTPGWDVWGNQVEGVSETAKRILG